MSSVVGSDRDGPRDPPARYLFRVTVRLEPEPGFDAEPDTFETVLSGSPSSRSRSANCGPARC